MKNRWPNALGFSSLCIMLAGFAATDLSAAPVGGDSKFIKSANEAVDRIAREDGFSGAILVAQGDQVLVRKAAGLADREQNIPNTPETKFPLQSVTKQFTAAAILLLVEDGKVSLADPISKYYPTTPPAWKAITIAQLLAHSSGIQDCTCGGQAYDNDFRNFHSYKDFIQLAAKAPLAFAPGKGFNYSNAGYALLAAVIERASGQSYASFLRNRIFGPLGMQNTGSGVISGKFVKGYIRSAPSTSKREQWNNGIPTHLEAMDGFGGIYSTVDDMLVWSLALDGDKFLSPASKKAIFTDYGSDYGFGWRFATKFGRKLIWHTGNDPAAGYGSIVDKFPQENLLVVALTNNVGLTKSTATIEIEGKTTTFPAIAAREVVEQVENLYFTGKSTSPKTVKTSK